MSPHSTNFPILFRILRALDYFIYRLYRVWAMVRDELAWACTNHGERACVTAGVYSKMTTFNPGGVVFEGGLYDWERDLLSANILPTSGRILLTGAGGGREIKALHDRGYAVWGFELADALAAGARELVSKLPDTSFIQASYEEYVKLFEPEGDRLRKWIEDQTFDIVWLGQGSYTHLTDPKVRLAVLEVSRKLAPRAMVVVSAFASEYPSEGRLSTLRGLLGGLLRRLGAKETAAQGDGFSFHGGFFHQFSRKELTDLTKHAGYEITLYRAIPQGQFAAVLTPV